MRVGGVLVLLVAVLGDVAWGYGNGAPTSVCDSMTPGHGTEQAGANSHTVTTSSSKYMAGTDVEVTISGTFQGMLLQARKADGSSSTPYGTFTVNSADNVKTITCSSANDAVTHLSTAAKTDLKVTWTPPAEDVGQLQFVLTVAEGKYTWWKNTQSAALTYEAEDNGTEPPTPAAPTTVTVPADSTTSNASSDSTTSNASSAANVSTATTADNDEGPYNSGITLHVCLHLLLVLCMLCVA